MPLLKDFHTPFQLGWSEISWIIPHSHSFLPSSVHGIKIWKLNYSTWTLYDHRGKHSKLFKEPWSPGLEEAAYPPSHIYSSVIHTGEKSINKKGFLNSPISFLFSLITIKATEPVNVANNVYFFSFIFSIICFSLLFIYSYVFDPKVCRAWSCLCPFIIRAGPFSLWVQPTQPYHREASWRTDDHPTL